MQFFHFIVNLTVGIAFAAITPSVLQARATECQYTSGNGTCILDTSCAGTSVSGYCSGPSNLQCCVRTCLTPSGPGFCENIANSCSGGSFVAGYCPGAADIECCVATCTTPSGSGTCQWTSSTCNGSFIAGYCPGPDDIECCVTSGSSTSTGTGSLGIDLSGAAPSGFWSCAAASYKVAVIEGYIQGCSIGGEVNANFLSNYQGAVAAGIPRIDAYMFPCTGNQSNNVPCKSPSTQLAELMAEIDNNNMNIDYLWLDIEPTSTAAGSACNAWNLGSTANEALAVEWVSLLQSSGRNWGIYANGNQWTDMFATMDTDIGSQLPLWAVQDDGIPGVNTVDTFMGGWTSAAAKQYSLSATECSWIEGVDLDSFL